jgi:copper homeostasis protein
VNSRGLKEKKCMGKPLIEICLENAESVIAAEKGGADRVELCSDLFEGGLSPTLGTVRTAVKHAHIPVSVMVRPRGGDFLYSDIEYEVMKEDLRLFRENGASSIVFGILNPDGTVDRDRTEELIDIARPLPVTFHRAFDMTRDPFEALETLISLGVDRILTSGQEATVPEGLDLLEELIKRAGNRIIIMPGCGISERNFRKIDARLKAKEYHVHLPYDYPSKMQFHPGHIYMGGLLRQSEFMLETTSSGRVKTIAGMK